MQTTSPRRLASTALVPLVALVVIFAAASPAAADAPSSLSWNAPPPCPSAEAVHDRLRRAGDEDALRSPIDARVSITEGDDDRWRGHVQIVAGHVWTDREIEAAGTCEEVVDAIVVILSVAAAAYPAPRLSPQPLPPSVAPAPTDARVPAPADTDARPDDPGGSARGPLLVFSANAQASFASSAGAGLFALFAPALDLWLSPRLSLGVMLVYEHRRSAIPLAQTDAFGGVSALGLVSSGPYAVFNIEDTDSVGGGLRVGYEFRAGHQWALWPTVSMALERTFVESSVAPFNTLSGDLFVPALLQATPHLFVGLGPDFELLHEDGGASSLNVEFGVRLVFGGWTGLARGPS